MSTPKPPSLVERAEQTRQALAAAKRTEQIRKIDVAEAEGGVAQVEAGWAGGDDTATAADLMAAQAEVTRATRLHEAASAEVRRATAALVNDDTAVAEVIASGLTDLRLFDGYDIAATAEHPSMPTEIARPTLYAVQTAAPELDVVSGRVSCPVEIVLHRPWWGGRLDVDDLPDRLAERQVYIDTHGTGSHRVGDVSEDRARLTVRGVWQDVPAIRRLNGENMFGQTLAGRVAEHCSQGRRGEVASQRDGYSTGSTTALRAAVQGQGQATPARIVSTNEKTGQRRASVDVSITLASNTVGNGILGTETTAYLRSMVGGCESGLGRVSRWSSCPTPPLNAAHCPRRP